MRHALKVFGIIALLLIPISPMAAETLQQAPLNPAFVEYQQDTFKTSSSGKTVYPMGRTPSPVDLSHLAGKSLLPSGKMATSSSLTDSSYDLREEGFISPIRNQDPYGNCWTYAAMASMESTAMKLLGAENPDLAEWTLTYYGYIDESDELVGFGKYKTSQFPATVAGLGGDDFRATAILSRWTGPALESNVPCGRNPFPKGASNAYHLSDVAFLLYDLDTHYAPVTIDNIKYALTTYGAISVGIAAGRGLSDPDYWKGATNASYIPYANFDGLKIGTSDHAVAIVGWDDTFPASDFAQAPPHDGAWIVRNSWGSDWGDNGYFYLSYYDAVLDTGAAYVSASADNFDHIYQYDPLGWCDTLGNGSETAWIANIFTARGLQTLKAVSFYAPAVDTQFEISVFTDVKNGPADGTSAFTPKTGTLHAPGYRTVELNTPVALSEGQIFSVAVKLTTPNYNYPIAAEFKLDGYSDKASAKPGESYFSFDGTTWTDLTDEEPTANVCLKAFTDDLWLVADSGELPSALPLDNSNVSEAFGELSEDLTSVSDDILALLGDSAIPGTLKLVGKTPLEYRQGNVDPPLTLTYARNITRKGTLIQSSLLVVYNHDDDCWEVVSEASPSAKSANASSQVSFLDGDPCDSDDNGNNDNISDMRLMEILVQAEVEQPAATNSAGGGGCFLGTFAPAALLLLIPVALLKKR